MMNTAWRVALGVVASSAFFWGVAGAVDLRLERTHKGYALPDGGGWCNLALFAGFIVAYFSVASLADTTYGAAFSRSGPRAQQVAGQVEVRDGAGTYRVFALLNRGDPHAVRSDRSG
ncbi:hypothetical protein ACFWRV_20395 [Streptomyces sp. NPDC058576]|uniref:hypothetical protein n=1 Tax=Streptomyces sp. NPDC058576 TaxID=3346547 RepID=UPI003665D17A